MLSDAKRELVLDTIGEVAGKKPHQVLMDSCLREDLGLNELDRVDLAIELEERLDIELTEDAVEAMQTVADVLLKVSEARHG